MLDEEFLIKKAKEGDIYSFEKLISSHYQKIYNLAYSLTGNSQDAQDIAQESIIKLFKSLKKFKGKSKFSTFIYRVVMNVFKDEMKKSHKKYETSNYKEIINSPKNFSPEKLETKIIIEEVLKKMPRDFAIIIILREIEGFSYEEISEILNIPVGTVKSRLNLARKSLKEKILNILKI
jgi:RNA polymerase sigma-70 factor (ECF subfamily)